MNKLPIITLRNLLIESKKCIGLQYYPHKVVDVLVNALNDVRYSDEYKMQYVPNTDVNKEVIAERFKGVAWVNYKYFYKNRPIRVYGDDEDFAPLKKVWEKKDKIMGYCPKEYLELLETRRYSYHTARTYCSLFAEFAYQHRDRLLIEVNEQDIKTYVHGIVKTGKSTSYQNQVINAIKFYFEQVLDMPQRFYEIDRPNKERKLPLVLSEEEIIRVLDALSNIKHKAILVTLYSCGLRISELLDLKLTDIQSDRKLVFNPGRQGKKGSYNHIGIHHIKFIA